MVTAEKNAEQAVDLLEKHLGRFMPDEEYLIEIESEDRLDDHRYGEGFQVDYRLETTVGEDGEWEFTGSHMIYGSVDDVQAEYEALISEFENRFEYSDLVSPELEV